MGSVGRRQDQILEIGTANVSGEARDAEAAPTPSPKPSCEITDLRQAREKRKRRTVQPNLPANLQDHIGKHLRSTYASLVREPIPQKILDVLRRLEAGEKGTKS